MSLSPTGTAVSRATTIELRTLSTAPVLGAPLIADTFQWERCNAGGTSCVDIAGATTSTYVQTAADVGHTIRVRGTRNGVAVGDSGINSPTAVVTATPGTPPSSYTPNKTYTGSGTFASFLAGLVPGDVASIAAGVNPTFSGSISHGGTSGNPIVLTSDNWASPNTIHGRLDMRGAAGWWLFDFLNFDDSGVPFSTYSVSWVCGGHDNIFRRIGLTNGNTKIGMEFISSSTFGVATANTVDRCHIHDIGRLGYGSTNNDHGIYDIGYNLHVLDTLIENCSDRGYQCRGGKSAVFEYSKISNCGEGVIFGDLGAVGSVVQKSVLINNQVASRHLVESYDPSGTNSSNVVNDNYIWNADGRYPIQSSLSGVTVTNLHNADPTGVSGYGPRFTVGPV